MNNTSIKYKDSTNPLFKGKKLNLEGVKPEICETNIVYRPKDTIFSYCAWPSVCSDENGTLYATSAAFGMEHICPFNKVAMYISKNNGKTWSPPIVVVDTYLPDGHGGIDYLGNGRLMLSWNYHPGDVIFNTYYNRIRGNLTGGHADVYGELRGAMMNIYPYLPAEKLVGGSYIKISEDYGITWSDAIRMPVANVHGVCKCKDGTLLYLGKEYYKDTSKTFEEGAFDGSKQLKSNSWQEYVEAVYNDCRDSKECVQTPMIVYASRDGGYTWEERGGMGLPAGMDWSKMWEPHMVELDDGTLFASIRVESETVFPNDFSVYVATSNDGGHTWSEMECTHIPGSPPHLLKHSSGKLICTVGCRCEAEGFGEYAYVSEDDGKTWTKKYVINDKANSDDLGYPCSTELADGSILTVYYQKYYDEAKGEYDSKPCILSTRWTL
ncbi:MAG: exo-alpha-sialidase [Clostridiales bacterium]|nr:exo-alpha-sialidase [Clostridiales bacterium]